MQVERKPGRWPYVGMLIALLVACLWAPSYWQTKEQPADESLSRFERGSWQSATYSPGSGAKRGAGAMNFVAKEGPYLLPGYHGLDWVAATGLLPNTTWPEAARHHGSAIAPLPTIDELSLSTLGLPPGFMPSRGQSATCAMGPMTPGGAPGWAATGDEVAAVPGPLVTATLHWIGGTVAEFSPNLIGHWVAKSVIRYWDQYAAKETGSGPDIGPIAPEFPVGLPTTEAASPVTNTASPWSVPDALFEQLTRLAQDPYTAYWAQQTISHLQALMQVERYECDQTAAILAALGHSADVANQLASQAGDDRMRVALLRAHWALARRLDCWNVMNNMRVAAVDKVRFASNGPLDSLLYDVAQRNDLESLGAQLEEYEKTRDPALAYRVAMAEQSLAASPEPLDRALADAVEQHYRNANIRVAITNTMLNRLVPAQQNETQPVWDRIVGTPVRGQSETSSQSRVQLEPATGRWQMNLESSGVVDSNTLADGGHARLRSYGSTDFTVRKSVVVEPNGEVRMQPAVASANNYNHLAGVTTDFDWVPLFSAFARDRAVEQYRAKRPQAKAEIECKVTSRVSDRLDQEASSAADRIVHDIRRRLTDPLAAGGVELTTIEMNTTSDRLVARLRIAGAAQLGGHTPRPQALSDSLASVQVHESALTNAAMSLGLDGQRLSAPQLQVKLQEKFPDLKNDRPVETREDTVFQFADQGAVLFHIEKGRFEIAVRVAEFVQDRQRIRNFIVHAYYTPVVNGMSAELVREGALGVEGRISAGERARLYSVFNEVLGAERHLPVMKLNDPSDARLRGLMITQFVLEDGWLGVAIGPEAGGRTAERSRSLR